MMAGHAHGSRHHLRGIPFVAASKHFLRPKGGMIDRAPSAAFASEVALELRRILSDIMEGPDERSHRTLSKNRRIGGGTRSRS